jgi:hypothetical protein
MDTLTSAFLVFRFLRKIEYSAPNGTYTVSLNSRSTFPFDLTVATNLLEYGRPSSDLKLKTDSGEPLAQFCNLIYLYSTSILAASS